MQVVCHTCKTKNRVPEQAIHSVDKEVYCGSCQTALLSGKVVELNEGNFQTFIKNNTAPLVVDFWAPWCMPCRMMAPQFEQAAQAMPEVIFAKINTQDFPGASSAYTVRGIPTLIVFKAGKELARMSGAISAQEIKTWVQQALNKEGG